jgi:hypothetical protein
VQSRSFYYEQLIRGYRNRKIPSFVSLLDIVPQDNPNYSYIETNTQTIAAGKAKPCEELPEVTQTLSTISILRSAQYEKFLKENGIDAFCLSDT